MKIKIKWQYKDNIILEGILQYVYDDGTLVVYRHRKNRGRFQSYRVNSKNIIRVCLIKN